MMPAGANPAKAEAVRAWAADVLRHLARPDVLPVVDRRKAIPRMFGALVGRRDVDPAVGFLHRLLLLDRWCRRDGVASAA